MKKLSVLFLSVVALTVATFTSCSKDEKAPDTTLELTVTQADVSGNPVLQGATVNLYASQEDWLNNANPKTLVTDATGKVKFTGLKNVQYFFDVEKDCINNTFSVNHTDAALVSGTNTTVSVPVISTGQVRFTNNSTDKDWDVQITAQGQVITLYTIPAGKDGYAIMPVGSYTIHMVEYLQNSDTTTGNTKDVAANVVCGQKFDGVVVP